MRSREVRVKLNIDGVRTGIRTAAGQGLKDAIDFLGEKADAITPRDRGDLIKSRRTKLDRNKLLASIQWTNPIATIQHENLKVKHADGRTAKYGEITFAVHGHAALEIVAAQIRKVTR